MGYRLTMAAVPGSESWSVRLSVSLTRAEGNTLFLSGDSMLAWPEAGLERDPELGAGPRLERSGMFISEVAARPSGVEIRYSHRGQAEQAAALLRRQLADFRIEEEN